MGAFIIDGRAIAQHIFVTLKTRVNALIKEGTPPGLAIILVGDDPASDIYTLNKCREAEKMHIHATRYHFPKDVSPQVIAAKLEILNKDPAVHGIIIQLPLPATLSKTTLINMISPAKDVDGLTLQNEKLWKNKKGGFIPCTVEGILYLLDDVLKKSRIKPKKTVVMGTSALVGKPVAELFQQRSYIVTTINTQTPVKNVPKLCQTADVLVTAMGNPHYVKGDWIKQGAIVIDVGINRVTTVNGEHKIMGDVDFDEAVKRAGYITPVPGGVGPLTIAMLLSHVVTAAEQSIQS